MVKELKTDNEKVKKVDKHSLGHTWSNTSHYFGNNNKIFRLV